VAATAIIAEHETRQQAERGWRWDAFARRYVQLGAKGAAINTSPVGA
jgi:hypothetical protein